MENAACYEQAADCLRDAETAMHHAKAAGRGRQSSFSPEMNARAKRLFSLGSDLHRAAVRGELELDYQPVFGLPENRTVGFEALIRWRHPLRGRLMPSEFITIAEDSGLISAIGEWALLEACRQAAAWRMAWIPPHDGSDAPAPWVAVNLSARQLADPGLADAVEAALAGAALAADGLRLEVTESVLMTRPEMAIETLSGLQQKGIAISLDDFGTGYSSIQTLDRLPVSTLKIDRGFVWRMDHPRGARMVTAIIQFAHVMDLEVVAEGVETAAQFRALADLGCSRVQGYYVAQPMSGEESLAWTGRPSPKWLAPEPVGL